MIAYLDESGDLGWSFDRPYGHGGSSRYLTIAFMVCPKSKAHIPKRIVKKLYQRKKQSTSKELKAKDLSIGDRKYFAINAKKIHEQYGCFSYIAITVNKANVFSYIKEDPNKLYNYMIRLALVDYISKYPFVDFVPDPRTIKVKSKNSLVDYLQIHLWFELNVQTKITHLPQESHTNLNIQFVDYLANIIWRRYEFSDRNAFDILKNTVDNRNLFF